MGERINNEDSIYYWAAKNKIPVFSPALTDGAFGDALYTHSLTKPGLVVDILEDARRLNAMALKVCNVRDMLCILGSRSKLSYESWPVRTLTTKTLIILTDESFNNIRVLPLPKKKRKNMSVLCLRGLSCTRAFPNTLH